MAKRNRRSRDERQIIDMFSYRRPCGSKTERAFIDRFLSPLGFWEDEFGNLILQIGEHPTILWSSHVDTVHRAEGMQTVHYDGSFLRLTKRSLRDGSNCLGADDTAGVWLMTEMIKAKVEGVYVIHFGEESGCIGSSALAKHKPDFFEGIKAAIAFDRMGYEDVITHQVGGRTASDAFARSLSKILGGSFKPCDGGVYTDTNEYAHLVPECTNVSVGYFGQHGHRETQDVPFLISLRNTLVAADWSGLVIEREPGDDDRYDYGFGSSRLSYGRGASSARGLEDLVKAYPDVVADLLESCGVSRGDLMDHISHHYGQAFEDDEDDFWWGPGRAAA